MSYIYKSDISSSIEAYLGSLTEDRHNRVACQMRHLDELCISIGHSSGFLDKELAESFCNVDPENKYKTKSRVTSVRKLAYFIIGNGGYAYIIPRKELSKRTKEVSFTSCLSHWMCRLVKSKQSLGFKYKGEKYLLHQFDTYLVEHGFSGDELTREMVEGYSLRPASESPKTVEVKLSVVRSLGTYMNKNGGTAYFLEPSKKAQAISLPSYYDNDSLTRLLRAADTYHGRSPWMKYVVPVYFRLLYITGMRENEGCCIERCDVDYEKKRILIRGAKNDKDRYIYISDFCCDMLKRFDGIMERYKPGRKYLFPSSGNLDNHIYDKYLFQVFNVLRHVSNIPESLTIHSLRHTYVIDKITEWENSGIDVNAMIPYLSKQLGHSSIKETYYYCQRLDCRFNDILKLKTASSNIIPEVEDEE